MDATSRMLLLLSLVSAAASASRGDSSGPGAQSRGDESRAAGPIPILRARYQPGGGPRRLVARWIGQDRHDYVGPHTRPEPSEVQDIHIALSGLDPRHEVVFVEVNGHGGNRWQYGARPSSWRAELRRQRGSRTADLFIEPGGVETGRSFQVIVRYDDGSTEEAYMMGRTADPGLRMPGFALAAQWVGQNRQDWTGPGPCVGPDGLQDARIHFSKVSAKSAIKAVRIECPSGSRWEFGTNPKLVANAELIRDAKDPSQADLYFQPDRDMKAQRIRLLVLYENDQRDAVTVVAGRCDPKLRMPESPLPDLVESAAKARWLGQDGVNSDRPGDVHVAISGLTSSRTIDAAVLSDAMRRAWIFRRGDRALEFSEPDAQSFQMTFDPDGKSADLFFAPYREAGGEPFTLRLISSGGRSSLIRFKGERCDLSRRSPMPQSNRALARPGDDLQALVHQHGTVVLSAGTYRLTRPLLLKGPVTLTSEGGATLQFAQSSSEPPWTAAIKIHRGNTTLNGFAVRFDGPVRWNDYIAAGIAVIRMTDDLDRDQDEFKPNIVLTHLDLEVPPVENRGAWGTAVRLIRLLRAESGVIANNILRGGEVEFCKGPWRVVDNEFRGTLPGTASSSVFVGHGTRDLVIRGNRTHSPSPSGKTWRFLVLTGYSSDDLIEHNTIEGLGARDDDTIPWNNEPEIILTEEYRLRYEGQVMAVSADGRVLRIGRPQGEPVRTGDVVSILKGSAAGQWRRVAQVIDPTTLLVDPPLPAGALAISIGEGFTGEVFQENRIDIRGGHRSDGLVFPGNHFGTRVIKNQLLGGGHAFRITSYPSEAPGIWGWTHVPFLGGVIEGNIIEDTEGGGVLGVDHDPKSIKSNQGRTYMTVRLTQNVVRWSRPFLDQFGRSGAREPLSGLTIGSPPSLDPGEVVVDAAGNRLEQPPGGRPALALMIHAATYNSQRLVNRRLDLSAKESGGRREAKGPSNTPVR